MSRPESVRELYQYYCEILGKNPNKYKLTAQRCMLINARLVCFSVEELKQGIKNFSRSAWHRDQGFDKLEKLFSTHELCEDWVNINLDQLKQRNNQYIKFHPDAEHRIRALNNKMKAQKEVSQEQQENKKIEEFYNLDPGEKNRLINKAKRELTKTYPTLDWDNDPQFTEVAESLAVDNYIKV